MNASAALRSHSSCPKRLEDPQPLMQAGRIEEKNLVRGSEASHDSNNVSVMFLQGGKTVSRE